METFPWLCAFVIAGTLVGGPASADTVTLRDALDAAWQRAVVTRESAGQSRRAEAELAAAGRLWSAPPALEFSHRDDRFQGNAGKRETEIGFAIPLWLPGQRTAQVDAALAAAELAKATEHLARLRLAGELREAAWQLAGLQADVMHADTQAHALKQLADDVERRVVAGDLARADALAAQAEYLSATALQAAERQRLQAARGRWTLLTGLKALPRVAALDSAEAAGSTAENGSENEASHHPELQLAAQATTLARKRVALMRASQRDAPELTLGLRQDLPGRAEATQGSLLVGFRLPLGTDDRNRPLEAAALADLDVAETQEQRLRERLDSDIATARNAQHAFTQQLQLETTRARLLRERASLIEKSYRAGETPLPELLRARAAAAQADSAVARQTAALGLARARFHQTLGLLP